MREHTHPLSYERNKSTNIKESHTLFRHVSIMIALYQALKLNFYVFFGRYVKNIGVHYGFVPLLIWAFILRFSSSTLSVQYTLSLNS